MTSIPIAMAPLLTPQRQAMVNRLLVFGRMFLSANRRPPPDQVRGQASPEHAPAVNPSLTIPADTCETSRKTGMTRATPAPPNLDPDDWQAFRAASRQALDEMIDFLQTVRERPVWQPVPAEVARAFREPLPT